MATPKYAIPEISASAEINDGPADINAALQSIDSKMVGYSAGPLVSRPTSTGGSPGIAGRRYRATDTGQEFIDTGTSWVDVGANPWRTVAQTQAYVMGGSAAKFYFAADGRRVADGVSCVDPTGAGGVGNLGTVLIPWTAADHAVEGRATMMRLVVAAAKGAHVLNSTYIAKLFNPTVGGSGNFVTLTLGAAVGNAASAALNAANSKAKAASTEFAAIADGIYTFGFEPAAAYDSAIIAMMLQVHNV